MSPFLVILYNYYNTAMKRITAPLLAVASLGGLLFPSCTLTQKDLQVSKLEDGVKYEVRTALPPEKPFSPETIQTRYFTYSSAPVPPAPGATTPHPRPPLMLTGTSQMKVRTTAYCHTEDDHISFGSLSALGTPLRFGRLRSAAADWSRYPVGTLFRIADIPDVIYQIDDYGSALVGTDTIDLYKPTQDHMNEWGVRHVDIEVLHWGSYARSMDVIRDRTRFPHVQEMFDDLNRNMLNQKTEAPTAKLATAML